MGEVGAYDFSARARRVLYGLAASLVQDVADGVEGVEADRSTVYALLSYLDTEAEAAEAEAELHRLPYPRELPTRAIDLVAALGRRWSVVDDAYRGVES